MAFMDVHKAERLDWNKQCTYNSDIQLTCNVRCYDYHENLAGLG